MDWRSGDGGVGARTRQTSDYIQQSFLVEMEASTVPSFRLHLSVFTCHNRLLEAQSFIHLP